MTVPAAWAEHLGSMSRTSRPNTANLLPPSARPVPHPSRGDGRNTLADIEVFVFTVEAELDAMDRKRIGVPRLIRPLQTSRRPTPDSPLTNSACVDSVAFG